MDWKLLGDSGVRKQFLHYMGREARGGVGGRGAGGAWGIRLLAALGNWLAWLLRPGSGFPCRMRLWKADTCWILAGSAAGSGPRPGKCSRLDRAAERAW